MGLIQKHKKISIAVVSLIFILNLFVTTSLFSKQELIRHFFLISFFYGLVLFEIYKLGKMKRAFAATKYVLILSVTILLFTFIPIIAASVLGILPIDISILKAFEINIIFAMCIAAIYYVSRNIHQKSAKIGLLIIINTIFLVNCLFVALLYSTGFEFNATVLLHIDETAIKVAAEQFSVTILLFGFMMLPISYVFYKMIHHQDKEKLSLGVASLCLLAVSANAVVMNVKDYEVASTVPLYSLLEAWMIFNKTDYDDKKEFYNSIRFTESEKQALKEIGARENFKPSYIENNDKKRNLILVYIESLQSNFTKRGGWPKESITPVLDSLNDFSVFDNIYNSVTPTINAVISSQCGIDLEIGGDISMSNAILIGHDKKMKTLYEQKMFCMSDYLNMAGYNQIFMKGAPMEFSGKGKFLESHGYNKVIGRHELNIFGKHSDRMNQWGVPDPILFREGAAELEKLRAEKKPFSLNILTINSHTPGFEDKECPKYKEGNSLLNGIHCTDYSLGWFLNYLKENKYYEDSVVILLGDHVMFPSKANDDLLEVLPKLSFYGKTYFSVRDPDNRLEKYVDTVGYTPDLAPTVLDLLGFGEQDFPDGRSLLASRKKYQRLVTKKFEVINNQQEPSIIGNQHTKCNLEQLNKTEIKITNEFMTDCQREKVYHAKHIFLYN